MTNYKMKLLKDIEVSAYCIKVDYFMWSEEKGEYTEPLYLTIDTKRCNIFIFREDLNNPELRVFTSKTEAQSYLKEKIANAISYKNEKVVKIRYNFEEKKWEECI